MQMRFVNSTDRSALDAQLASDSPVPRVGDTVVLPLAGGECSRWVVKAVVWDYAHDAAVDVIVTSALPARVPSFAAYGD